MDFDINVDSRIEIGDKVTLRIRVKGALGGFVSIRDDASIGTDSLALFEFRGEDCMRELVAENEGSYEVRVQAYDKSNALQLNPVRKSFRIVEKGSSFGREQELPSQLTQVAKSKRKSSRAKITDGMFGYTFHSPGYKKLCMDSVESFTKASGLACVVLSTKNDGNYDAKFVLADLQPDQVGKADILDLTIHHPDGSKTDGREILPLSDHRFIYFDNDVRFLRPFSPWQFDDGSFWAVPDCANHHHGPRSSLVNFGFHDCRNFDIDPDRYFNAGFVVWGAEQYEMMRETGKLLAGRKSNPRFRDLRDFGEQSLWNLVVQEWEAEDKIKFKLAEVEFNTMICAFGENFIGVCENPIVVHAAGISFAKKTQWLNAAQQYFSDRSLGFELPDHAFHMARLDQVTRRSKLTHHQFVTHEGEYSADPITGMTCVGTQQLLNSLGSRIKCFVEVGAYHGANTIAAAFGNPDLRAYAFEEGVYNHGAPWGVARHPQLIANVKKHAPHAKVVTSDILGSRVKLGPIDAFFYDGEFGSDHVERVIAKMVDQFSDTCVLMVANWKDGDRRFRVERVLHELSGDYYVDSKTEIWTLWNAIGVFIVKRHKGRLYAEPAKEPEPEPEPAKGKKNARKPK